MKIKILQAGRYNNLYLTAIDCEAGQVLETHDWYADELVALGIAEAVPGAARTEKIQMPRRTTVDGTSGKKNKAAKVALPQNPFVAPVQQPLVATEPASTPAGEPAAVSGAENSEQTTVQPTEGEPLEGNLQSDPTSVLPSGGEEVNE